MRRLMRWRRPSRAALAGFGVGLALALGAAAGAIVAAGNEDSNPVPTLAVTPFAPGDPEAAALGLTRIDQTTVPPEGTIIGGLRLLPPGSVPDRAFRDLPRPGERREFYTSLDPAPPVDRLRIPQSPEWEVRPGGVEIAVGQHGTARVLFEGADVRPAGARHSWRIESGNLPSSATLPVVLNYNGSNYLYQAAGVPVVVKDGAPRRNVESVWRAYLVVAGRWVLVDAPVVPFEQLARFLLALVEANQ